MNSLEYSALRQQIEDHRAAYYVRHAPLVSDAEFDELVRQLATMETTLGIDDPTSPTKAVGSDLAPGFQKVRHSTPMLSLDNIFTTEEIQKFFKENILLIAEPKIDGLSLELRYDKGCLQQAVTRGNGTEGDDVTAQARTINSIPKTIAAKYPLRVRGEVYMKRSVFAELNTQREKDGEDLFKNPRNAASGSLKQRDPAETAKRRLDFLAYWADGMTNLPPQEDSEVITRLIELGFTVPAIVFRYTNEAHFAVAEIKRLGEELDYDLDGCVLKINSLRLREELGTGTHSPKWAVAYKFPPERKITRLLDIIVTVGRTGQLCPNSVLAPVDLSGATVTAASLMNADEMVRIGSPAIGDDVYIEKAGEIVPRCMGIAKRNGGTPWVFPTHCPSCNTPLVRDGVHWFCPNHALCPAQIEGALIHATGKTALDWDGCGPATIQALIKGAMATRLVSLFLVQAATVRGVLKGAAAAKFLAERERVKTAPLWRKLHALGIEGLGSTFSKELAQRYGSLENIITHSTELTNLLGPVHAQALLLGLQDMAQDLDTLEECGFIFADSKDTANKPLAGMTFVITGTLVSGGRDQVAAKIEAKGGLVKNSVSKNTSYLVSGEAGGQAKAAAAQKHGIKVIDEAALYVLMGEPFNPAITADLNEKEY